MRYEISQSLMQKAGFRKQNCLYLIFGTKILGVICKVCLSKVDRIWAIHSSFNKKPVLNFFRVKKLSTHVPSAQETADPISVQK